MGKRKAPPGCYWREDMLYGRIQAGGRDIRWSLRTDDPTIAWQRRKAERSRAIAVQLGDARRTFQEAMDAWGQAIAAEISPKTLARYASSLSQLQPYLEGLYLDEIDKALIGEIVKARKIKGITNATIRRDLTALSSVMGYAEAEEWIPDNPVLAWLRPGRHHRSRLKERRDPIMLPDPRHVAMVIADAPPMFGKLIAAARQTGCRQAELAYAKRSALDHSAKQLIVRGKGNKQRVVELDGWGYDDIFRTLPAALGSPWLFHHHGGQPYRTVAGRFRVIVARVARKAQKQAQEFRRFRFHDLRHLHAVEWLKAGKSIYDLQQRFGHRSIRTTEIYLEFLTPEEQRRVKNEIHAGTKTGTDA